MNDEEYLKPEPKHSDAIDAIHAALIEGEASGEPQPFDVSAFKERMRMLRD